MKPKMIFGLFVAVATVQLAVPVSQIVKHEDILATGQPYKFRTAPVDPYDAFRGRYVALSYADTATTTSKGVTLDFRATAWVALRTGADGFAKFGELTTEPPPAGDYLRVECLWASASNVQFRLPFDKFFMEESKAPKAEEAWRSLNRPGQTNDATYALVRVKGGRGVIEDLYINHTPIREFLAKGAARK